MKTIKVLSITKASAFDQNHVTPLLKQIRPIMANAEPVGLDFSGVKEADVCALQQTLLPLVSEFGGGFVRRLIRFTNHNEAVAISIRNSLRHVDEFIQDEVNYLHPDTGVDQEIYDLNVALLIKCRELARTNPLLARLQFGLTSDSLAAAVAGLTTPQIQELAKTGINVFKPNFDEKMIETITRMDLGDASILIGIASCVLKGDF